MLAEVTTASKGFLAFLGDNLHQIIANTGFANVTTGHLIMIGVGLFFLYLAISRNFEPMLLVPIGFGILVGNIPFSPGMEIGIYEDGSVLNYLYFGVIKGIYPPLIFLGIGAMTDFFDELAALSDDELRERIRSIAAEHGMTLNDAQTQQLADLFRKIQSLGGSNFAERVQDLPETVEKIRESGENALSTAGTVWDSIRGFFQRVGKTLSAIFGG